MKKFTPYILTLVIGIAALPIPLLRDFHFESAMIAGIIGCFWAGIRSSNYAVKHDFFPSLKILGYLYLASLPLFIYSLFSSCLTIDGVGFWVFIPFPSVFFGAAIGRLIRKLWVPFPKTASTLILVFCAIGIWLFEFLAFPQVYFFNHVWGVWPGPIYDEAVNLTGSFFYFRGLTFLWIVLLWILPEWNKNRQTKLITGLAVFSIMLSYLNLDEMGVISPRETIQQQLGGHHTTQHFDLYFDEDFYTNSEIQYWAARHEFHLQQITDQLEIDWPPNQKIESYLYAHAWQKKKITGAKFTSYVPIWLEQDQLHIAKQQLDGVLKHELVHVISKQFGNRLFNGSWSMGLIEGLAEGIAKDASSQSTLHQIVAAEKPFPTSGEMKSALSVWGFYREAGAISYTTTGSFVEYLLDEFPPENIKQVYASGDFNQAYPISFEELISGWHQTLDTTQVDSVDQQISEFIFAQRSLFQKACPHSISKELRLWDEYQFLLADKDTTTAHKTVNQLYTLNAKNELVLDEWVRVQLSQGNYARAAEAITPEDTLLTFQALKADAFFLHHGFQKADSLLQIHAPKIASSPARNFRYTLQLREDSLQWHHHTQRRFLDIMPDSATFPVLNFPNQMLSLDKALQKKNYTLIKAYASLLPDEPPNQDWFKIYEDAIGQLAFYGEEALAHSLLRQLSSISLRMRYSERLEELRQWVTFIKYHNTVAD